MQLAERIQAAAGCNPSPDVWSGPARDMLRIAAFAGFDVQTIMRVCFSLSRANRINAATVERAMGLYCEAVDNVER
jgi:hypothetical protein